MESKIEQTLKSIKKPHSLIKYKSTKTKAICIKVYMGIYRKRRTKLC